VRRPNDDEQDSGHATAAAAAEWVLAMLAEVAAAPAEMVVPLLESRLARLPGVAAARFHPAGATVAAAAHRLVLAAGGSEFGTVSLHVDDEVSFATWLPLLPTLGAVLEQLLQRPALARQLDECGQQLRNSEQRFRDLFDHLPDPCWLIERGHFTDCNRAAVALLGYAHREDILQHPSRLSPQRQPDGRLSFDKAEEMMQTALREGVHRFEWEHQRADGSCFPAEVTLARIRIEGHDALYCVWRDITQRKRVEQQAYDLAFFDPLTHLPNRRLLHDRLEQAMANSVRSGCHGALAYLDLDHFKVLNDTRGHDVGDRLLAQVALRLRDVVRGSDTVARMGGDEFVVLIQPLDENAEIAATQAHRIGEQILAVLAAACDVESMPWHGSASIGIALFHGHGLPAREVLKRADLAMYQAKAAGRNALRFFDPSIQVRVAARAQLEADLRLALAGRQLTLQYQPQVDACGHCIGVEALLRWQHPQRGAVAPIEFITLAEETGLITSIGQWVLGEACRVLDGWTRQPAFARLQLAVNVSARQFYQGNFVASVSELLRTHDIEPSRLRLELTESMLLGNLDHAIDTMRELKDIGVRFSLDDFGTGYSSLNYVKRLPIDQIKIDQSFVRDIHTDANDAAICRAVIAMGRSLGLSTVAEGVETAQQWEFLAGEGCDAAQGYLYAPPLALDAFADWLREHG